jgi:aminopeptidase-like protein
MKKNNQISDIYYDFAKNKLFRLNRSLTGDGTKKTLRLIKKKFPSFKINKIKSKTKVFDWSVPPEWNVKQAYIEDLKKKKIVDFKNNNLHLVGYSAPIKKTITKKNLLKFIFTNKKIPNAIPYVTSYYKRTWGFCMSQNDFFYLQKKYKNSDKFKVLIDSKFNNKGYLEYGELVIKGLSKQEILITTYICHPSMANNELSGPIVSMSLISYFLKKKLNKTLRFIFIPETIGSISYINKNFKKLKSNVIGGYNISCVGDESNFSCILSKYKNSPSDFALLETFKKFNLKFKKYSFLERGSDERQFNSPFINLGITTICKSKFGNFKEYHTSLDNFSFVTKKGIYQSFKIIKEAIKNLSETEIPVSNVICEPHLSKRKLYPTLSKFSKYNKNSSDTKNILNFLQYADQTNSIYKISKLIKLDIKETFKIFNILKKNKLIRN